MLANMCAGGLLRFVIWILAHDREYSANELGCPNWGAFSCCTWCLANRGCYNVREVGPAAHFEAVLYRPGDCDRRVSDHPVWDLPGVTRFTHMGDFMHGGDIGTHLHLHGSSLAHITRRGGPYRGSTRAIRVRAFFSDLLRSYAATEVAKRLQTITPELID